MADTISRIVERYRQMIGHRHFLWHENDIAEPLGVTGLRTMPLVHPLQGPGDGYRLRNIQPPAMRFGCNPLSGQFRVQMPASPRIDRTIRPFRLRTVFLQLPHVRAGTKAGI